MHCHYTIPAASITSNERKVMTTIKQVSISNPIKDESVQSTEFASKSKNRLRYPTRHSTVLGRDTTRCRCRPS